MQQVKIFKSVDTEIPEMERQINRWMRKSGARVLSITGNIAAQNGGTSPGAGGGLNTFAASEILVIVLFDIDPPKAYRPHRCRSQHFGRSRQMPNARTSDASIRCGRVDAPWSSANRIGVYQFHDQVAEL